MVLALSISNSSAQIIFHKTYGFSDADYGYSVKQTLDGGYILLGQTPSTGGAYSNAYLIKTNQYGDTTWTKQFGDNIHSVQGWDVYQLLTGEYLLSIGYNLNLGMNLIKTTSTGNIIWNKFYAGSVFNTYGCIDTAIGGGYVFLGKTFNTGHWNTYVLRTNINGDSVLGKTYGTQDSVGLSIRTTSNGYVICGGTSQYSSYKNVLMKIDNAGNRIWTKLYGLSSSYNLANSLDVTNDGGFVFTGKLTSTFSSPEDVFLTKTNSLGVAQWTRTYGGSDIDIGFSVKQTSDHGYAILGVTQSMGNTAGDFYLIKTDSLGFEQWHNTYGGIGSETGYCLASTSDGGYALFGNTWSYGAGFSDYYFVKTNSAGVTANINDLAKNEFSIFPNPTTGKFKIDNGELNIKNIYIYNLLGEKVFVQESETVNPIELDVTSLTRGIYFMQLQESNNSSVRKFVKQ